jgi:hypothetical protein
MDEYKECLELVTPAASKLAKQALRFPVLQRCYPTSSFKEFGKKFFLHTFTPHYLHKQPKNENHTTIFCGLFAIL